MEPNGPPSGRISLGSVPRSPLPASISGSGRTLIRSLKGSLLIARFRDFGGQIVRVKNQVIDSNVSETNRWLSLRQVSRPKCKIIVHGGIAVEFHPPRRAPCLGQRIEGSFGVTTGEYVGWSKLQCPRAKELDDAIAYRLVLE